MPSRETVEAFIALVEEGKYDVAIERFYAADASMQENLDAPRKGRAVLVEGERRVMGRFKEIRAKCLRPVLIEGDHVVVHWLFEFEDKAGGAHTLDELAHQRWRGEEVLAERFYYDPAQMRPSAGSG
jgi:hypothetical protein